MAEDTLNEAMKRKMREQRAKLKRLKKKQDGVELTSMEHPPATKKTSE